MSSVPIAAIAAVYGLLWGSFAGVLVDRVPRGDDAVGGRSRCDGCGAVLRVRDLVPVVSWIALRGRCSNCRVRISPRWTVIEIACGLAFALVSLAAQDLWQVGLLGPLSAILLALALIDLEHRRLPNAIVYPSVTVAAAVVILGGLSGGDLDLLDAVLGMVAFGGTLLLIAVLSRGGMGLGDVKLAGLIGFCLGAVDLRSVGVAAGAAILLGGMSAVVALLRGADRRSALPFGPMLAAGAFIAILLGPPLADAYLGLFR